MQFGFGAGVLTATRNDIANGSPIRFGALQDISVDFDGEIKELYAQGQVAIDARRGKMKIQGKAKMAALNSYLMSNLFFGQPATVGQYIPVYNEAQTVGTPTTSATSASTAAGSAVLTFSAVPAGVIVGQGISDTMTSGAIPAGTYVISKTTTTVTMSANVATGHTVASGDSISFGPSVASANATNFFGDLGVFYAATGQPLLYVTSAPTQGQYTESNGVYVFNVADAGAAVLLNYIWSSPMTGYTIAYGNPFMGNTPKFQANFFQQVDSNYLNLVLYSCISSKLNLPTKIDDYIMQEFDFSAFQNAAGQTFQLSMSN
jgi:hypothetical protein